MNNTRYVTHERYVTYDNRANSFYAPYRGYSYGSYNDGFSPFLMGWLMSDALNSSSRATWIYNHRDSIDDARYQELIRHDAKLQAELEALKARNVQPNPNYVPQEFADNPDLMYAKNAVVVEDTPADVSQSIPPAPRPMARSQPASSGSTIWTVFGWIFVIAMVGTVIYFLCIKEYK